jgi:tryptophan-rich sensory protein
MFKAVVRVLTMVILCCGVGVIGWFFTKESVADWYPTLQKPLYTPPSWAFGVVWPVLYVLMGLSAGILWNKPTGRKAVNAAIWLFLLQLVLNGLWTPLFFGLHEIQLALIEILLLWLILLITTIVFYIQSTLAGVLLTPYLLWISFAVYLNAGFWNLNR